MKNSVNVLFVCGYGLGSSSISEIVVTKAVKDAGIACEMKHTALGEMNSYYDWVDIIAISKKLMQGVTCPENIHMIEVVNIMDGKTIAQQIGKIVDEFYPDARIK